MNIDYIIIFLIILNCIINSYTDLREGVVRNQFLFTIGILTIFLNVISLYVNKNILSLIYIIQILISTIIALLLYFFKIWAGGDCKFYIFIILSTPCFIVNTFFLGISIIIYIPLLAFMLGYVYIIVDSFVQKHKKQTKEENIIKKSLLGFVWYLKYFVLVMFINRMITVICAQFNIITDGYFVLLLITFFMVLLINKIGILKYNSVVFFILILDIWLGLIDISMILNRQILLTWSVIFISNIIRNFASNYNYSEICIDDIETGMILSTKSSIILSNDKLSQFNKISDESLKSRLTEEDVKSIKGFAKKRSYLQKVEIIKKVPFAFFIAIATIVILLGRILT